MGGRLLKILICLGGWSSSGEELDSGVAASLGIAIGVALPKPKFANRALPKKIFAMPQGGLIGVITMGYKLGESLH